MRRLHIIPSTTFLIIFSINLFAAADSVKTGINFEHGSWSEITSKAKQENKLIFLDAYASWCGPCKWMAKNIFPNDTVGDFYNKNFVCAKIDMEKGEGIELAKKFDVRAYPTFLYISQDGESLVHRTCGSTSTDIFIQNGKDALDPAKQLMSLKKKFDSSTPNAKEAYRYLELLRDACMDYGKEASAYLSTQKEADLSSADNWEIIHSFLDDPFSREFKYLQSHKLDFENLFGKDLVNKKIADVYNAGFTKAIRKGDMKAFDSLKEGATKSLGTIEAEKITLKADLTRFQKSKDWKNFVKTADSFISKFGNNDPNLLNSVSWTIYENIADKAALQKAEKWSKHASELNNIYSFNDTYAAVLYKLGKKNEAKQAALKAIELAKKEGADSKSTEELLLRINQKD